MKNLATYIPNIILGYIKSLVISFVVLPILGTILFVYTSFLGPELSFLNYGFSSFSGHFDGGDIMKLFGIMSLVLYLIIELLKLSGLKIVPSFKRGFFFISAIFFIAIILVLYPTNNLNLTGSKSGFIFVFFVFWITAIIAYRLWYFLNKIKFQTGS